MQFALFYTNYTAYSFMFFTILAMELQIEIRVDEISK